MEDIFENGKMMKTTQGETPMSFFIESINWTLSLRTKKNFYLHGACLNDTYLMYVKGYRENSNGIL
jgi:hypothetical protein